MAENTEKGANGMTLVEIWEKLNEEFGPDIAGSVCVTAITSETVAKMKSGTAGYMFVCAYRQRSRLWKLQNREREMRSSFFGRTVLQGYLLDPKDDDE